MPPLDIVGIKFNNPRSKSPKLTLQPPSKSPSVARGNGLVHKRPHPTNHQVIGDFTRGAPPSAPWERITLRRTDGASPLEARPSSVGLVLRGKIKPRAYFVLFVSL